MKLDTRWLAWNAAGELTAGGKPPASESRGFGGFVGEAPAHLQSISLEAEPAAYELAFQQWLGERCALNDRAWGGLRVLHRDYAAWCAEGGRDVPAGLPTFEKLVRGEGLFITESGLLCGVLLREDLWMVEGEAGYGHTRGTGKGEA